jgi:hypothetical protein
VEVARNTKIYEIAQATGRQYGPHELADGFLRVANAKMVQAIRTVSIAKGADPRQDLLVAFGGALYRWPSARLARLRWAAPFVLGAGFASVRYRPLFFGAAGVHVAVRP